MRQVSPCDIWLRITPREPSHSSRPLSPSSIHRSQSRIRAHLLKTGKRVLYCVPSRHSVAPHSLQLPRGQQLWGICFFLLLGFSKRFFLCQSADLRYRVLSEGSQTLSFLPQPRTPPGYIQLGYNNRMNKNRTGCQ